ncbi:MAG: hypothetical protein KTR31_16905 [Myxococcales bacterium]|nr:hypothetical protein [Myxococcales bacterium]
MAESDAGAFLELKQRVVYSLLRAATRTALRLRMPLKQLTELVQMAYFQEAREQHGLQLEAIAQLFGRSLRTVSSLHRRYRGDFFAPEREVSLRRAVAALVNESPATDERLAAAFAHIPEAQLAAALSDLEQQRVLHRRQGTWHRNPDAHDFSGNDWRRRVDGLNRQLDVLAEAVWHRIVVDDAEPALARTYVFRGSDEDVQQLLARLDQLAQSGAIESDDRVDATGRGRRFGVTFAAGPMPVEESS